MTIINDKNKLETEYKIISWYYKTDKYYWVSIFIYWTNKNKRKKYKLKALIYEFLFELTENSVKQSGTEEVVKKFYHSLLHYFLIVMLSRVNFTNF